MPPSSKSENLVVVAGPSNIDGGISRVVRLPDGSGRIEDWSPGKGWVLGTATLVEFIGSKPVSPALAARMGCPASELGSGASAGKPTPLNPAPALPLTTKATKAPVRSPTWSEMDDQTDRAFLQALEELSVQIPVHRGQSFRRIADSVPVIADSRRRK